MKSHIEVEAFAKINIGLEIQAPLKDGFHPILGIFHSVGISDKLICIKSEGRGIQVEGAFDCPPRTTTVYRAAELFFERFNIHDNVIIRVGKGIPAMAGLGGGSADAAATLIALDQLYGTNMAYIDSYTIAAKIGADVSFFLHGGAAIASGRGDIIEPIRPRSDFGIILLYPGFGVSTKWAYAELDSFRQAKGKGEATGKIQGHGHGHAETRLDLSAAKKELATGFERGVDTWDFTNSFSPMLHSVYPVYFLLEAMMKEAGACFVSITGSGSCLYGVFRTMTEACEAEEKLKGLLLRQNASKTLYGMALHAMKPLETSLLLG